MREADPANDPGVVLTRLARETEQLAKFERANFSPLLRRLHPAPIAVAAVTLHGCFGVVLREYLGKVTILTEELVRVLHSANRLEKALAQMTAEDAADCEDDRARAVVGDMEPYEVESVVMSLLKAWMDDRLRISADCLLRAKETEVTLGSLVDEVKLEFVELDIVFVELDSQVQGGAFPRVGNRVDEAVQGHHRRVL